MPLKGLVCSEQDPAGLLECWNPVPPWAVQHDGAGEWVGQPDEE